MGTFSNFDINFLQDVRMRLLNSTCNSFNYIYYSSLIRQNTLNDKIDARVYRMFHT